MGKAGYKRFKKQEKAKVKLKGNKALLPKGQNVTDTNFKVKKIVVKEQLKQHGEEELLSKRHLNIKELISRLSHHNVSMRQDALTGLKELVATPESNIVHTDLSPLLNAIMTLTVDIEGDVRIETIKLLSAIFEKVPEVKLSPLFPAVVSHLTCAMTHIEPSVRTDCLRLLDTMLATQPSLTVTHVATLLPHFLDLISQRGSGGQNEGRTLSLHLDGRVTSEKWRARVIGRLNRLLNTVRYYSPKGEKQQSHCVRWNPNQKTYLRLFSPLKTETSKTSDISNLPIQDYTKMLMPLLIDAFIEAVPPQDKDDSEIACVLGLETVALLQSIVEVILHLWELLKHKSQGEWFCSTWGQTVVSRLLKARFPFTVAGAGSRKRRRDCDQMLAALQMIRDPGLCCSLLNLQLCQLSFLFSPPGQLWTRSLHYIKQSLRNTRQLRPEESATLCSCLEAAASQPSEEAAALLGVLTHTDTDSPVDRRTFQFLTNIVLQPQHHLHEDKHLKAWLDSLPALLCKPTVPLSVIRSIANIATRARPAFIDSLDGWVEGILDNLPHLRVIGDSEGEGHRLVVGLLYWVTDWDPTLVHSLELLVQGDTLGPDLTDHLLQIVRIKIDNTEDSKVKEMLSSVLNARSSAKGTRLISPHTSTTDSSAV